MAIFNTQGVEAKEQMNPFADALYGAGSDLIKTELGACGERLLGSGSTYLQGNIRYFKAPIVDINAPDLSTLMAFGTYLVLAGFFLGINGKFSPEALGVQATNGLLCWLFEVLLLKATLHTLGDGDVPLLDIVAYGGYMFAAVSITLLSRIVWS